MRRKLLQLTIIGLLITFPVSASALMGEAEAYATVHSMIAAGSSPVEIVAALKADGRTQAESTVFAMVSGGEDMRVAFATAGVKSAASLPGARSVANAVWATAGETGRVAEALVVAMNNYRIYMDQPSVYTGGNIAPGGGAVSPST